jgi:hypothetical protein
MIITQGINFNTYDYQISFCIDKDFDRPENLKTVSLNVGKEIFDSELLRGNVFNDQIARSCDPTHKHLVIIQTLRIEILTQ